jgi:hypothetical protein
VTWSELMVSLRKTGYWRCGGFALDTQIRSERRWPLRSTAFSDRRPDGPRHAFWGQYAARAREGFLRRQTLCDPRAGRRRRGRSREE